MSLLALIPARGGSQRVLNKNLLPIGGVPLLVRAIRFCHEFTDDVVVTTDSPEIHALAKMHGAEAWHRPPELATPEATIDDLVAATLAVLSTDIDLLLYQPTVVGVSPGSIKELLASSQPTALAILTHGVWKTIREPVDVRINSQYLERGPYREVGVRFYPSGPLRATSWPTEVLPVADDIVDIDTPLDLVTAEAVVTQANILIRYVYGTDVGSGHYRRALAIAERLQHHNVSLQKVGGGGPKPGTPHRLVPSTPAPPADLIINDTLDTTVGEMASLRRRAPVITFEDLGPGARLANAVVNDLYPQSGDYGGHRYSVLRPEFLAVSPIPIAEREIRILVTFGGTDPARLTHRVHHLLGDRAVYVNPPGVTPPYPFALPSGGNIASLMANAKMVITSAGRTVYEAAALGTPAFVIAQNPREATHAHLGMNYGNHFLGHHAFVTDHEILALLRLDDDFLQQMRDRALYTMDHRGLDRIIALIESTLLEHR